MKKLSAIGESVIYFLVFSVTPVICALIISLLYILFNMMNLKLPKLSPYLVEIIACALIVLILYFILKAKKVNITYRIKLKKINLRSSSIYIFFGLSVYFVLLTLLNLLPMLQGSGSTSNTDNSLNSVYGIDIALLFIAKSISAPIVEEITFRGLIYSKLKEAFPRWVSSLLVSLVFGVLHFSSSVITVVLAISMSLFFNNLVDKYNSIVPAILGHSAYNFVVTFFKMDIVDFNNFEIPLFVVSLIVFFISIICIIFDIKKINRNLESANQ